MVDHLAECFNTQVPVAYGFVPVLMALIRIFCVVDMDCLQPLQPYHFVKCFQHLVCIVFNVITGIKNMACIQANAHAIPDLNAVNNGPELFKGPAYLGSFSGHCLEQDPGGLFFCYRRVQSPGYQGYAFFNTLLYMASRVQVIQVAGSEFHPVQIVNERIEGKFPDTFFGCAQVRGIGGMCQDGTYVVLF